jgi:ribose transport system ATP-binding protein
MRTQVRSIDAPEEGSARDRVVLEKIHKRYGSTHAVNNVSIRFRAGEVHALLGENGAGKSTVGKIIGGLVAPDEGRLLFEGNEVRFRNVAAARDRGVAMVFQELSLAPHLTVRDNICLGSESARSQKYIIRRRSDTELCKRFLEDNEFDIDIDAVVADLSVANQQLIEVIKALVRRPRVLILDEPTAMLGVRENEKLIAIIRRARAQGVAIVFVTHHVEEVLKVADRVSLMKDGALVDSFDISEDMDAPFLVAKLVGRAMRSTRQRSMVVSGDEVASISNLPTRLGDRAEISIRRGEIIGLYGVVGSGCEKIGHAMVGLADISPARLTLLGSPYRPGSPAEAAKRGVSYLPSGRAANCILPTRSISENLMLTQLAVMRKNGVLSDRLERDHAKRQLRRLKTRYADSDLPIVSLSGGNQQKVLFGRSLGRLSSLLVLEDPSAGVDVGAKQDIHEMLAERARDGLSVLLISSDLLETIAIAHVIYTVIGGKIVRRYDNPSIDDEEAIIGDVLGSVRSLDGNLHLEQARSEP